MPDCDLDRSSAFCSQRPMPEGYQGQSLSSWLGYTWVEPDMEDVFMAYFRGYYAGTSLVEQSSTGE